MWTTDREERRPGDTERQTDRETRTLTPEPSLWGKNGCDVLTKMCSPSERTEAPNHCFDLNSICAPLLVLSSEEKDKTGDKCSVLFHSCDISKTMCWRTVTGFREIICLEQIYGFFFYCLNICVFEPRYWQGKTKSSTTGIDILADLEFRDSGSDLETKGWVWVCRDGAAEKLTRMDRIRNDQIIWTVKVEKRFEMLWTWAEERRRTKRPENVEDGAEDPRDHVCVLWLV